MKDKEIKNKIKEFDEELRRNKILINLNRVLKRDIFKSWFIDFNFPMEDGRGYKSNGGRMKNTEIGEIPEDWHVRELGSIMDVKDVLDNNCLVVTQNGSVKRKVESSAEFEEVLILKSNYLEYVYQTLKNMDLDNLDLNKIFEKAIKYKVCIPTDDILSEYEGVSQKGNEEEEKTILENIELDKKRKLFFERIK